MKRPFNAIAVIAVNLAIFLIAMEVGLRLVPSAIPEVLLRRFEPSLRSSIAERRSLPNVSDVLPVNRDDGGPPLLVFKPNTVVRFVSRDTKKVADIVMDEMGFCNPPGKVDKKLEIDVVAVGDSFTACTREPFESTAPESFINWPYAYGRIANAEVYSLARGGYGVYEYVQLLKHYGLKLRPKTVIMQIYEGNDLRDAVRYKKYVEMSDEEKANVPLRASWEPIKVPYEWLLRNELGAWSYSWNFAVVGVAYLMSEAVDVYWRAIGSENAVDFRFRINQGDAPILMNPDNDHKDEVRTARSARAGEFDFSAFDDALVAYAALSREYGFKAVLSYAPAVHVAYEDFVEFEDPDLNTLMPWYSEQQRRHLQQKSSELGIVFVDLTPVLQAEARKLKNGELLYNPVDIHFTPLGHSVVARGLHDALQLNAAPPLE